MLLFLLYNLLSNIIIENNKKDAMIFHLYNNIHIKNIYNNIQIKNIYNNIQKKIFIIIYKSKIFKIYSNQESLPGGSTGSVKIHW